MPLHIVTNEDNLSLSLIPQLIFAVGRITPTGLTLLGTSFAVAKGRVATTKHVTSGDESNLVIVIPRNQTLLEYQDTSDKKVNFIEVKIASIDPFKDICILSTDNVDNVNLLYRLSGTDNVLPGSPVVTFGFPHADYGRLVITRQDTHVGARVLIEAGGLKSKHIILNTQARPGQSGSPVLDPKAMSVIGMLIGSYAPSGGGFISIGGVDPSTLHQTTHVISAEYIQEML